MSEWTAALQRLGSAQKGHARGAPAYSVYVNRPIGRVFAATAFVLKATPNQVTLVSALFTFVGLALVATVPPSIGLGIGIAVLLAVGYALDSADGQLARLRGGGSLAGEWLDHFVDSVKIASMHLCVAIGIARFTDLPDVVLLIPLAFSVVAVVSFFGMLLNDLLKAKQNVPSTHARGGGSFARSFVLLPTDYGVLCLVFVLWGLPPVFLVAYVLLLVACTLFLILAAIKWFREIRSLDRIR